MFSLQQSQSLQERAAQVVPGGVYGHQSPVLTVPGKFPVFAERAKGPHYWDTDGNRYIDFMCGYGPTILGAAHPEVEEAVRAQAKRGDCFNHPTRHFVELAEKLVSLVDMADWAFFAKNGADTIRWAIRVARETTGRKTVLRIKGAYHGTDAWSSDSLAGVIEDDRRHVRAFKWNDPGGLEKALKRAGGDLAAIIITPYHHPAYADSSFATDEFREAIHRAREITGCLLVLDDIRAGFRLHLGGSHRVTGWEPDLICLSKAIANGYPLSACAGRAVTKIPASRVFATGSFWMNAIPMVAALKTIEILEREDAPAVLHARGKTFLAGMEQAANAHGIELIASGPPATPFLRVANDPSFRSQQRLCSIAVTEGLFFHPHHNWFLSLAHTDAVLADSIERFGRACRRLSRGNG